MKTNFYKLGLLAALSAIGLTGCAQMEMGSQQAKTVATGSAGGANSAHANDKLQHCARSLGTLALQEDQGADWYYILSNQYHLPSTTPVIKLLVQQSNCFVVVERGRTMRNMMAERELAATGEMRKGSKFGKGQMVAADFTLSPSITFSNNNAGGIGGVLGAFGAHALGAIAANVQFKEASVMLTLVDNRSGVQLAAAEGSARNMDFGGMGAMFGGGAFGGLGGYTRTAEGKVLVAAFADGYNNMVEAVRNYKTQNVKGGLGKGGQLKVGS